MKHEEAISIVVDEGNDAYKRGVIAGRKEVCDWINAHSVGITSDNHLGDNECWKNQLKKWGTI